jgi:hypothetical protein
MRTYLHFLFEMNMVLLVLIMLFVLWGRSLAVAWGRWIHACTWLFVFASIALVIAVRFVLALLVVGLIVLILWIFEAFFESVLTLWPVEVTGLEGLVVALGGTLVDLFVVALVVIMTLAIAVFATDLLLVVVLTIRIAALVAAIVVPLALI